ncbi:MAG TPA: D-hexose-6-phosphate mutarotase [Longimicrobium sp.]|nr:D-hexose-6-phosphate mutarotase [Longimicrobium sp.]
MTTDASAANAPEPGEGGLPRIVLASPDGGRAEVYLHGAHVARWTDASGRDVLFLSRRSPFAPGEAIRGGIPVIFPQFAEQGPLPKHGFARTAAWTLAESSATHAVLGLTDTPETRAVWDFAFRAELRVALSGVLEMSLAVENTGGAAFEFTCALHSYFRVADIHRTAVLGLRELPYRDKVEDGIGVQETAELRFCGETDRVYVGVPDELRIVDEAGGRTITIDKRGFPDAVVWNPGARKARGMVDLGEEAYPRFVCVEAGCVGTPVRLEPGGRWEGGQVIRAA